MVYSFIMIEYRQLPKGKERIFPLGLGTGCIQHCSDEEIEKVIDMALSHHMNFLDLCGGGENVYRPVGRALETRRSEVYIQLHFGAVYNERGEYAWTRDLERIRRTIAKELGELKTDYIDFGFLHCIDSVEDYQKMKDEGIVEYVQALKDQGVVHHIGFSSHTPEAANRILDDGICDMMMFSINPAYEFELSEKTDAGSQNQRNALYQRCQREGVGISVMKPFFAGKLLDAQASPFGRKLSIMQCIQFALDRPAVLSVVPGPSNAGEMEELLRYLDCTAEDRDYSILASEKLKATVMGNCVYCSHCQPCPAGIDIALVNKCYDLAKAGDLMARGHYDKLRLHASDCLHCLHCDDHCPFAVKQSDRMSEIASFFGF